MKRIRGAGGAHLLVSVIVVGLVMAAPFIARRSAAGATELLAYDELVALYENEPPPAELQKKLDRILQTPVVDNSATAQGVKPRRVRALRGERALRVALWNIERGLAFDNLRAALSGRAAFSRRLRQLGRKLDAREQARVLQEAELLSQADVVVLNEVDWGLKRTHYRNVARELAAALKMNYAFGVEFVEVDPLTLGIEKLEGEEIEDREETLRQLAVETKRTHGLHGNAILSRYPLKNVRIIRFQTEGHDWYGSEKARVAPLEQGKRKVGEVAFLEKVMREVRRGGRMMLLAEIEDAEIPGGRATIISAHIEARTKPKNRRRQLEEALAAIKAIDHPVIFAGDFNTSGSDSTPTSIEREVKKRLGDASFWTNRGLKWATGFGLLYDATLGAISFGRTYSDPTARSVRFISENDEAGFFETLEEFRFSDGGAFDFRGQSTKSADGRGGKLANSNERASKGFKPTYEPTRSFKVARLKLDWIFVKPPGLTSPDNAKGPYLFAPHYGRTLQALNYSPGERISDHNPLTVDLPLKAPARKQQR